MPELPHLIEDFLEKRGVQGNSYKAYQTDLKICCQQTSSLESLNKEAHLRDLRLNLIDSYAPKTVARRWSSLREFLGYCQQRGLIQDSPIWQLTVDRPNQITKSVRAIDHQLLESICLSPSELKHKAQLCFFYATGLRASEYLRHGYLKNLNLPNREFHLPDRVTFLSDKAAKLLSEYLQQRADDTNTHLGLDSYIFDEQASTEHSVYQLFRRYARKMGLDYTLKDLRLSLLQRLQAAGASPEQCMYLLGFQSRKSMERFLL